MVKEGVDRVRVDPQRILALCQNILEAAGAHSDIARPVAQGIVQTSLRGVDSHGVRLLPHYVKALRAGRVNGNPKLRFHKTAIACAVLDADDTFGHAAGARAMCFAMDLAKEAGVGSVAVKNSSHFGAAAHYALMAADAGMIGLAFTHADSLLVSTGGKRSYLGTNPIAFAAPMEGEAPLSLDMATSLATWNKVLQMRAANSPLPAGWAVDREGRETRDPQAAAAVMPAGAHKGYGLSMMVEIFCSLLTGMPFGHQIVRMYADPIGQKRKLGHFFCAIDISRFVPLSEFKSRLKDMADEMRREPALDVSQPVQIPGDPEKNIEKERLRVGIPLTQQEYAEFSALSREFNVPFLGPLFKEAALS